MNTRLAGLLTSLVLGAGMAGAAAPAADGAPVCGNCVIEKFATCGGFLEGATFDAQGHLWVVDLLSGKVHSVSPAGQCTLRGNTGGQPNGARFGPDGQLWIADKQLGLLKMDPASGAITPVVNSYRSERLRGLNDLAFDAAGGVYFTEPYGSNVLKPDGRLFYLPPGKEARLQVVSDALAFPNGVAVTASGRNVLVGEFAARRILSLPAFGSPDDFDVPYVYSRTEGGTGPDGMLLSPGGALFAANFGAGEVLVFDATGRPLETIRLPGGLQTTNVALRDGALYVTEASRGEIWRVKLSRVP